MIIYKSITNLLKISTLVKKKQFTVPKTKNSIVFLKILLKNNIISNFLIKDKIILVFLNNQLLKKQIKFNFLNKKLRGARARLEIFSSNSIFFFLTNSGITTNINLADRGGFLFLRIDF